MRSKSLIKAILPPLVVVAALFVAVMLIAHGKSIIPLIYRQ
jgi:hypothetical protein